MKALAATTVFAIVTSLTLLLTAGPAGACTCLGSDIEERMANADAIFVGTPITIFDGRGELSNPDVAVIEVTEVFKGQVVQRQAVATPSRRSNTCSVAFVVGTPVTIVASTESRDFDLESGIVASNFCSVITGPVDIDATPQLPDIGQTDASVIQAQLGTPRSSLLPEALIFVGVLAFILGLASWFSLRDRRRANA